MSTHLPEQFVDLEPLVGQWALATERERYQKRTQSSWEEIVSFYDVISPRIPEMAAYLDQFPLGPLEAQQRNVLYLAMMSMDVGLAIDFYGQPQPPDAFPVNRLVIGDFPQLESGAPNH